MARAEVLHPGMCEFQALSVSDDGILDPDQMLRHSTTFTQSLKVPQSLRQ